MAPPTGHLGLAEAHDQNSQATFAIPTALLSMDSSNQKVLSSNNTLLEKPPFLFGPAETLSDGQFEVYVVTARNPGDYMRLVWDLLTRPGKPAAKLSHWAVKQSVRIDAVRRSPLVQADGDMIGHTPVEIRLVPKALHVLMPKPDSNVAADRMD